MAHMAVSSEQLVEALRPVQDPELHRSIVDLGMLREAHVDAAGTAHILVALTVAGCPLRNEIQNRVRGALGQALLEGASPAARQRHPCTWTPPCALDLLFRQRPLGGLKAGAPPPYSLAADLGRHAHKRGNRGRRALVHVGRPHMERHRRDLEAEGNH